MPTILGTTSATGSSECILHTWTPLANGDDGAPLLSVHYTDKSIQFQGTFGTGGSVQLEGSNDGIAWHVLQDFGGNALTLTSAGLRPIAGATRWVRPRVTAGDGSTAITCVLFGRQ